MHFRNTAAALGFFLSSLSFASAQYDDAVVFVTMTTEVEVTSTVYVDTVTMTGHPTVTEEPVYVPLTTILANSTYSYVPPTSTVSISNDTAPTSTGAPSKDTDSGAAGFSGSIRVAVAAGALAAVMGML